MEDYNARLHRETIENIAVGNLLESLREDFEAAERGLMKYMANEDSKEARSYRDGVQSTFNKVYEILEKA